ncbi:hypothetical protein PMAYCL1PPCAC_05232, partial [Pristionchus mayeri]
KCSAPHCFLQYALPTTALLTVHFVYRYLSISAPEKLRAIADRKFLLWLTVYLLGNAIAMTYVSLMLIPDLETSDLAEARNQLSLRIGRTINNGWLSICYWRNGEIVRDSQAFAVMVAIGQCINLTVTFSFGILTFLAIRNTSRQASQSARKFQMHMLMAICAQERVQHSVHLSTYGTCEFHITENLHDTRYLNNFILVL